MDDKAMTAPRYTVEQLEEFLKETESRLDDGIPTKVRLDKLSSVLRQAAETERQHEAREKALEAFRAWLAKERDDNLNDHAEVGTFGFVLNEFDRRFGRTP